MPAPDLELPPFDDDGLLPPGDYQLTLQELRESSLVGGTIHTPATWDAPWRLQLVDNLSILVAQLWKVGIADIFIDGSFVEDKDHPSDIDGYFVCELQALASGELQREPPFAARGATAGHAGSSRLEVYRDSQ